MKYALCYLCGQERLCRISGLSQRAAPALLNLRAKDCDILETGHADRAFFSSCDLGGRHENIEGRHSMREQAKDHAHQGRDSMVPIHELEPQILKMPCLRSIRDLNPDIDISWVQLTERALYTLPADEAGTASDKSHFSVASNDDDDDDDDLRAEFSDFGDRYGTWRKRSCSDSRDAECALLRYSR